MMLFIMIFLLYLVLLLLPFMLANSSLDVGTKHSLVVKSENLRDPRYFSKAFGAMMERALKTYDGSGVIRLSKPEVLAIPPLSDEETVEAVVLAQKSFAPTGPRVFQKEIYCQSDARIPEGTRLRAITCNGELTFMQNCDLGRWADGVVSMTVMEGCHLGISASSANRLVIAAGCTFRRLYAPEIQIGEAGPIQNPPEPDVCTDVRQDVTEVPDLERLEGDVICVKNFMVGERAEITGSLKTRKHAHIKSGARIMGNLIADGNIVLERNVFVGGIVFSQSWIYIGPDCQIGRAGRIKSVVARDGIVLAEGARVFGYVSGEHDGSTIPAEEYMTVISDKY